MKKKITISLHPRTHKELEALAKAARLSRSGWIEQAIKAESFRQACDKAARPIYEEKP